MVELINKHHELLHNVLLIPEGSWSTVSLCNQGAHAHCSNEEKKTQVLQEISTAAGWRKVIFSEVSSFTLVRGVPKVVRSPSSALWYEPKFTGLNHETLRQYNGVESFQGKSGQSWFVLPS